MDGETPNDVDTSQLPDEPLEHAFERAQIGFLVVDELGTVLRANPAGAGILGTTPPGICGSDLTTLVHPDDLTMVFGELQQMVGRGGAGPIQFRILRADLEWVWIRGHSTGLPTPGTYFVVFEDTTGERELSDQLARAKDQATRRAAQQAVVARLSRDALRGAPIDEIADAASSLVAATLGAMFVGVLLDDGADDRSLLLIGGSGLMREPVGRYRRARDEQLEEILTQNKPTHVIDLSEGPDTADRRLILEAGTKSVTSTVIRPRKAPPGVLSVGIAMRVDLAEDDLAFLEAVANTLAGVIDSHQALDELRFNALHDDLTELPNRALVLDRLQLALEQTATSGCQVAVLMCDVDRFKVVNDGMGHAAGDHVLRTVADRLRHRVRPGDTVGRFGGDEFVIVCPEISEPAEVIEIAERLRSAFTEPMRVLGTDLVATASIGIALSHDGGPEAAPALLRDADAAMYRAKSRGRARYELFDDEMRDWASERLRIESELRHAIAHDELVLHYQPVMSLADGSMIGVEALVRWEHPTRGLLQPGQFLPVAQEAGIMAELGTWTFATAAAQTAAWVDQGIWDRRATAVNLAPQELGDPDLVDRVDAVLSRLALEPGRMRVELTEEALVEDTQQAADQLGGLRDCGLGISIDDFGTGYSSLAYLKRLPVDRLKLDRSFVSGLGVNDDDHAIAQAVVSMAKALGLRVVAEGVETQLQLDTLRGLGCDNAQGFYFARPLPADDLLLWLSDHKVEQPQGDST